MGQVEVYSLALFLGGYIMKILGNNVEFNLTDVDNMEKINNALEGVEKKSKEMIDKSNNIKKIRMECEIIRSCFIEIFGNDKLLPENNDYKLILQAFTELTLNFAEAQEEANKETQNIMNKAFEKYNIKRITG